MKQTNVNDLRVQFLEYRPEKPVVSSIGAITRRVTCLVTVVTEDGLEGVGESWVNFPDWAPQERRATIENGVRPLILGMDSADIDSVHRRLVNQLERIGLQWGALGPIWQAISAVDMALWDIAGKRRQLPVWKLLGGKQNTIPVYASGLGPDVDEALVRQHLALGINIFKLKVGRSRKQDLAEVAHLRDIVGSQATILVDANQGWSHENAQAIIPDLYRLGVQWVEEPLRADDLEGTAALAAESLIPIALGENLYGREAFRRWTEYRAVQIVQPDLSKCGGFTEARAIVETVKPANIPYAPHFLGSAVGLVASAHFLAGVPGGLYLELDTNPNPLRDKLCANTVRIDDGRLKLAPDPGLGVSLARDILESYTSHA